MIVGSILIAVGVLSWWLGVCSMALWQNWQRSRAAPIAAQLMPRELVEVVEKPSAAPIGRVSEYAPKPKPRLQVEAPLRARANKLRHWPKAIAEKEKPPAMIEAKPRASIKQPQKESEGNTNQGMSAQDYPSAKNFLPNVEFGK
jgi:hypothetical protein